MRFLKGRQILWLLVPAAFVVAFLWDSSVEQKPDFVAADNNPDYYLVNTSVDQQKGVRLDRFRVQ